MENTKTGKRIPIKEAKEIGVKNGYNQVIITAWDINTNTTSVCTWGKSMEDCDQAAQGGNFVKKALGWPEKLTNEKPSRVKKLERETTQLREENNRLRHFVQTFKEGVDMCSILIDQDDESEFGDMFYEKAEQLLEETDQ